MRVSIIIVSWNALPLLKQCLPSVAATDYPEYEIILADNASTDGSADWVRKHLPSVRIVRHPENWAFCRGNNEAVPHATGDVIVFLNNDVEVPVDWLNPIVEAFRADVRLGAVQPKLLQYTHRDRFEYAGACGGFIDRFGYPFTRGRVFFTVEGDRGQYDEPMNVFWATGAAMAVRREAIERVGLFDEHFVMHMEEIDLCWRLHRHGYAVRVEPRSVVYHIGGGSLPQGDVRKVYFNFRNSLLLLYKNLSPEEWRRVFPVRVGLDLIAALRATAAGRPSESAAIFRALNDAHRMKHLYRNERAAPNGIRPPYRRSIVLDYFVRGKKKFSDLPPRAFDEQFRPAGSDGASGGG